MSEFIAYLLGFTVIFRLMAMFGRERVLDGEPVVVDGELVRTKVSRGKYRRIVFLAVGFAAPGGWRFNLRREGFFDRFAKWIGLAREFQTRDTAFDPRIYIECDDAVLHRHLGARRPLREEISSLFEMTSIESMACVEGRLWFTLNASGWDKELTTEQIGRQAALPLLAGVRALREQMAAPLVSESTARDPTRVTRRHFAFAILGVAIAGAIGVLWQHFHEKHQVVVDNIPRIAGWVTIAIAVTFVVTMLAVLGGTARTQRVFLDILFAAIPAAWFATTAGAMYLNESLDPSAARRVPVLIERAWVEIGSKNSHRYYAAARWPDARGQPVVRLDSDEYQLMQTRNCVDVLWHAGRFGDGWIERYQPHNSMGCDEGVEK